MSLLMIWTMRQCSLKTFADDTRLGEVADMPEGCAAIQRDFGRLEKCADRNLIQINKRKCKVLDLRMNNVRHMGSMLGVIHPGNIFAEKVMVVSKMNMQPAMRPCHKEGHSFLDCIKWHVAGRSREIALPLYSALVRPHLEYCAHFLASQYKREMEFLS
ncbi:mitochondrial enolase superfamily member 1 [Grus japonensis]|uniref:Mitochondrial enolase superfamily member 1 n=1 Tax=Grus japonensis TaxID=30415 RepID=A0ABC9Y423_GRUJA